MAKIFNNTCHYAFNIIIATLFLGYNNKKNLHMLNAVPLTLRIKGRGFLLVGVVSKISAN